MPLLSVDPEGKSVTCSVTGSHYPCNYNISCKSLNIVSCKTCLKQYVGQTQNKLAQRFSGYFFNVRQKENNRCSWPTFLEDHRGISDFSINSLEFIQLLPLTNRALQHRLLLEKHGIHQLRSPASTGLNILDWTQILNDEIADPHPLVQTHTPSCYQLAESLPQGLLSTSWNINSVTFTSVNSGKWTLHLSNTSLSVYVPSIT